jgi:hypothetical protein
LHQYLERRLSRLKHLARVVSLGGVSGLYWAALLVGWVKLQQTCRVLVQTMLCSDLAKKYRRETYLGYKACLTSLSDLFLR